MQTRQPVRDWLLTYLPATPVGPLWVGVAEPGGWAQLKFGSRPPDAPRQVSWRLVEPDSDALRPYLDALQAYFDRAEPVPPGPWVWEFTPFRAAVYAAVRAIPPGQTRTYGQIAAAVGRPRGARAVGQALARNPIPLVVPCHRVVAADGSLGGFSAEGGVALKARLLMWERGQYPLPVWPAE
ncbi:MAG: methylated-DNA--[protein]-cysteine S-methyltransferase [Chloroflexi bacterium]|nr:methylated-DNA--[protein]-cysteine S-methyltransferase [Chloroflexota bacterium]